MSNRMPYPLPSAFPAPFMSIVTANAPVPVPCAAVSSVTGRPGSVTSRCGVKSAWSSAWSHDRPYAHAVGAPATVAAERPTRAVAAGVDHRVPVGVRWTSNASAARSRAYGGPSAPDAGAELGRTVAPTDRWVMTVRGQLASGRPGRARARHRHDGCDATRRPQSMRRTRCHFIAPVHRQPNVSLESRFGSRS